MGIGGGEGGGGTWALLSFVTTSCPVECLSLKAPVQMTLSNRPARIANHQTKSKALCSFGYVRTREVMVHPLEALVCRVISASGDYD